MLRHAFWASVTCCVLGACSSTPVEPPNAARAASPSPSPVATPTPAAPPSSGRVAPSSSALPLHLDPNSALSREHSVYFDFDDSLVHSEYMPVVERQARYLVGHPSLSVAVQGNTDERGGSEYNLALGQRRADAVKRALLLLGVKDTQVEATSFGEERPAATEHDEKAWRENRRADILYRR